MDIFASNVRILVNPLANTTISHFISAQITWTGVPVPGFDFEVNGLPNTILDTENNFNLQTENKTTI
jgi:hypothetical protein